MKRMIGLFAICAAAVSLDAAIVVTAPKDGACVATLSDGQKAFLALPRAERIAAFADHAKRDALCRLSGCPMSVAVSWEGGSAPFDVSVRRIPDGKSFYNARTEKRAITLDNLEIARRYEVTVCGGGETATSTFSTEDVAPRLVRVPGVPNVRDLGGWRTVDGRRVKQGLALRTAGFNENADDVAMKPGKTRVSAETREVLLDFFGVKTDVDLRCDNECLFMNGSPLGRGVRWCHLWSKAYGMMNTDDGRMGFAAVFRTFLEKENYPIAFHCIGGKDRTGSVAFILNALLGVSEDDLRRDWEATGFWLNERDFVHKTRFDKLVGVFDGFEGETLHARVAAYVRDLGFTDADIEKFRSLMLEPAAVDAGAGLSTREKTVWIDGRDLPLEGKAFSDAASYYHRLPKDLSDNVNAGVHRMQRCSSGMQFRFVTDSPSLEIRWRNDNLERISGTMSPAGGSGVDVYRQEADGRWTHVETCCLEDLQKEGRMKLEWKPGAPSLVNLPLYNGIEMFKLGVAWGAKVEKMPPRKSGVTKPVVFYGSSITQGACASRPGRSFVNIVGRELDVPVVNLGFSGAGKMEIEMSDILARIDASCYVLDSIHNMSWKEAPERFEPFVRNLRKKRPGVPIVICEQCDLPRLGVHDKDRVVQKGYAGFKAEGWKGLVYLPKSEMYADDEGTVDGLHPNDWGNVCLAKAYGRAVKEALGMRAGCVSGVLGKADAAATKNLIYLSGTFNN